MSIQGEQNQPVYTVIYRQKTGSRTFQSEVTFINETCIFDFKFGFYDEKYTTFVYKLLKISISK